MSDPQETKDSEYLTEEDKLLFNLNVIGNIRPNEKLKGKRDLLKVEDRWFQFIRRYLTNDSCNKTLDLITATIINSCKKVDELLNSSDLDLKENQIIPRKALLQQFYIGLYNSKKGLQNLKSTYPDTFTNANIDIVLEKANATIFKLGNYTL